MNIQVTGYKGMLGKEVCAAVARYGHKLIVEDVDITNMPGTAKGFDVLINCAGLVPQRDPVPSAARMIQVNGFGPYHLAGWCDKSGKRLIHISTDCVFDGSGEGPHSETSIPNPITDYGKSKLTGEIIREPHLTVRTSFVGFGRRGLISELYKCVQEEQVYKASDRYWWTGHTARYVAEILVILAEREINGRIHIPGEKMSRFHLVEELKKALDLCDLKVHRRPSPMVDRRLKSDRWETLQLPKPPSFDWQLEWLSRTHSRSA